MVGLSSTESIASSTCISSRLIALEPKLKEA